MANLKEKILRRIKSVEVLKIEPGDILLVKFNGVPSKEEVSDVSRGMKVLFPNRVCFYDEKISSIKILRSGGEVEVFNGTVKS